MRLTKCLLVTLALCAGVIASAEAASQADRVAATAAKSKANRSLPPATIEARRLFFGGKNVNRRGYLPRNRVIVSWLGVSSLAVSFQGKVVLLDTFLNNKAPASCTGSVQPLDFSGTGYVNASYNDLVALDPRAIFIGHDHYDHACGSGFIAAKSGARIIGVPGMCDQARKQAVQAGLTQKVRCQNVLSDDSAVGASVWLKHPLGRGVQVQVVRHLHSALASAPNLDEPTLLFRFKSGSFSMVWNDSQGPLREGAPALYAALRRSAPVDVQFGSSLGLGIAEQGVRDTIDYAEAFRVKRFYPLHHDLAGVPGASKGILDETESEFVRQGLPDVMRRLVDPDDYLKPIVFHPKARRWAH